MREEDGDMVNELSNNQAIPKLTYFDVRGRAEVIRLMLEETDTVYRERRISFEEWPEIKSSFPLGQLPIYEEGGLLLNQSNAIYRYLARKLDLYGDSSLEQTRCDIIQETFVDAQANIGGFFWNPEFEKLRDGYEQNELPALLGELEAIYCANENNKQGGGGYWVGNRLSYVDFLAWHFLEYVRPFSQRTLDRFEMLAAFKRSIESRPRIAAYLISTRRPKTFTVAMASFGGTAETS